MFKKLLPVLLALSALPAGATTVYTSYNSLTNANPTLTFNTVDLTPLLTTPDAPSYTFDGVTFTAGSGNLSDAANPWGTGVVLKTANTPGSITIQLAPSVVAFGAMFGYLGTGSSTLGLSGSGINEAPFVSAASPTFLGAYSNTGFTAITFDSASKMVALNNFVYGTASPGGGAETPEPSTFALVGLGLIAFPWIARRRRTPPASER